MKLLYGFDQENRIALTEAILFSITDYTDG